jgi:DNA-3-methyladenine glycosylase I
LEDWVKLFKLTFKFTGGEITKMFLQSTGWIPHAHSKACPVYKQIEALQPPWMAMDIQAETARNKRNAAGGQSAEVKVKRTRRK